MVLVQNLFSKNDILDFLRRFIPWYLQKSLDVFHGNCRLRLPAHSFHFLFNLLLNMRRQVFRVDFFLQVRCVGFAHSSTQAESYSSFAEGRRFFVNFGHIVSDFFLNVYNGLDVFRFKFKELEKLLNFKIVFVHLEQTEFFWQW